MDLIDFAMEQSNFQKRLAEIALRRPPGVRLSPYWMAILVGGIIDGRITQVRAPMRHPPKEDQRSPFGDVGEKIGFKFREYRAVATIVEQRIERLHSITSEECVRSGSDFVPVTGGGVTDQSRFALMWDGMVDKEYRWMQNPYVWVVTIS